VRRYLGFPNARDLRFGVENQGSTAAACTTEQCRVFSACADRSRHRPGRWWKHDRREAAYAKARDAFGYLIAWPL